MAQICIAHRDSNNVGNKLDYYYHISHINDEFSEKYYFRRNKALLKLASYVVDNELSDRQKEIFLLHISGQSNKYIAELLNVNPSTVTRSLALSQKIFDKAYKHFQCFASMFVCD